MAVFGGLVLAYTQRQEIYDWWRLRGYTPSAEVAQLATDTTMNAETRRLFYVNHPLIEGKAEFNASCPDNGGEQTIVLGCYIGNERGIFIYKVSDPQLDGVQQVTAAHETLHAAYERLGNKERTYIDGLLQDYYDKNVHDKRLIDTINAYKKTEPNDVLNEMHSIFGTEIADLPTPLEDYYKKYFNNRQQIAAYAAKYQGAFTTRQTQIAAYDAQLAGLKSQIESNEANLNAKKDQIDNQRRQLDNYRANGEVEQYNAGVDNFNALIISYNSEVNSTKSLIDQYNALVKTRNDLAVETDQLINQLNSKSIDTVPTQ